MKVIILGCGPAGLMAAHAAVRTGAEVQIVSQRRKSELFGAQYLHAPIPGATDMTAEPVRVKYITEGDVHDYRTKVYGQMWDGNVSPEDLDEDHDAWDIRQTYDWLWEAYNTSITNIALQPSLVATVADQADLVISTIPRPALCSRGHTFSGAEIWAAGDAPDRDIRIPYHCHPNTVICNGNSEPAWYRMSNIYGMHTVEWPGTLENPPPVETAARVVKPTRHNCDCNPRLAYAGRYGRWEKGVLSHTAYFDTLDLIVAVGNRMEAMR